MTSPPPDADILPRAEIFRQNVCLLMDRHRLEIGDLARRGPLSRKVLLRWIRVGARQPRGEPLARLARIFGLADPRLLFAADLGDRVESWPGRHQVDRQTNPLVEEVVADEPHLFARFGQAEWNELYSLHGTGGALTREGVRRAAEHLVAKKELRRKFEAILETEHFDALASIINLMYRDSDVEHAVVAMPAEIPPSLEQVDS
jgi:hypothetical protein